MHKKKWLLPFAITLLSSSFVFAGGHEQKPAMKHKKFSECAAIRMKEISLDHLSKKDPSKYTTPVPEGWTVVSGSGGEGHPKLLICR